MGIPRKALVTGINGFLGSHLAKELLAQGVEVHGMVRNPQQVPYLDALGIAKKVTIHACDLKSFEQVKKVVAADSWDYIFHLGAQSDLAKSIQFPLETIQTNVMGGTHLLESMRVHKMECPIILGGSVRAMDLASKEDEVTHPYDASKAAIELIAKSYFREYKLIGGVVNNTNIYGPNDLNFYRLIPKIMKGIFTEGKMLLKGDGKETKDFMYVMDYVSAIVRLGEMLRVRKVASAQSFVFATGKTTPVESVVNIIRSLAKVPCTISFDGLAFQPIQHRNADKPETMELNPEETMKQLNWKPSFSLEQGMQQTMEWYHDYFTTQTKKGSENQ